MATTTKNPADTRKSAIAAVLTTLDADGGCYCEGRNGKNHDVNPPCYRVKQATLIVDSISHLLATPVSTSI